LQGGRNADTGQGEEGEDLEDDSRAGGFSEKWGWIANVDAVSETCRCSWNEVWQMTAMEFLNILCYRMDKIAKEQEEIEKWKRTH
jgi:hypothetical protein